MSRLLTYLPFSSRLIVALLGCLWLVTSFWHSFLIPLESAFITVLFISLLYLYPLATTAGEVPLFQSIAFYTALLYGPYAGASLAVIGIAFGYGLRHFRLNSLQREKSVATARLETIYAIGSFSLSLLLAFQISGWNPSLADQVHLDLTAWSGLLVTTGLFVLIHAGLQALDRFIQNPATRHSALYELALVSLAEISPLPFVLFAISLQPLFGPAALFFLGLIASLASLLHNFFFLTVAQEMDRLTAGLDSVNEGILMIEPAGRIGFVNPFLQTICELNQDQLIGRHLNSLSDQALATLGFSRDGIEAICLHFARSQPELPKPILIKIKGRKMEQVLERSLLPVCSQRGKHIGWMAVFRDRTDEQRLAEVRELLTHTVIHDIRSPASTTLSAVELIAESIPKDQQADALASAIDAARSSTHRILSLLETLLDIARLQNGEMETNLSTVNLCTFTPTILAEFTPKASELRICLSSCLPKETALVEADPDLLTRILGNLLENALNYSPDGSEVIIKVTPQEGNITAVSVADHGPGIPEEFRQKIFDRFSQIPGQPGRRRGSGLGLALCRMAVEAQGGQIWVEPHKNGISGSVFTFTLKSSCN